MMAIVTTETPEGPESSIALPRSAGVPRPRLLQAPQSPLGRRSESEKALVNSCPLVPTGAGAGRPRTSEALRFVPMKEALLLSG
jgi:hypothetical protein